MVLAKNIFLEGFRDITKNNYVMSVIKSKLNFSEHEYEIKTSFIDNRVALKILSLY